MATMDQIAGLNEALGAIRTEITNLQQTVTNNAASQNQISNGASALQQSNDTQHAEIRQEIDVIRTNLRDAVAQIEL